RADRSARGERKTAQSPWGRDSVLSGRVGDNVARVFFFPHGGLDSGAGGRFLTPAQRVRQRSRLVAAVSGHADRETAVGHSHADARLGAGDAATGDGPLDGRADE